MTNYAKVPVRFGGEIRRVTDLQVQEGEEGRIAVELATTGRVGELEGVLIDFTHPDLPPDEWWARPWWHVFGDGEHHCGIVFPGEAAAPKEDWDRAKADVQRKPIYAVAGDTLKIGRVQQHNEVSNLHHMHDIRPRLAYLTLIHADGTEETEIGPLAFYGSTRLIGHGAREAFDNAIARIAAIEPTGLAQTMFDSNRRPDWQNGADVVAKFYAAEAHDELFAMIDALNEDDTRGHVRLRSLVNAALLAGFALAQHEAERAFEEERRREERRKLATKARTDPDREICARTVWTEKPHLTTNAVAEIMMERWPEKFQAKDKSSLWKSINKFKPEPKG
ncbi:MAG TPA: hypothetical protein VN034_06460 [Sphingopyxis sp.]|nr:hypothetical protein [Sphingopyxis sp.]